MRDSPTRMPSAAILSIVAACLQPHKKPPHAVDLSDAKQLKILIARKVMKLRDLMTENVEVITPDTSLEQAARKMRDLDVGVLPVCDGERLLGMLSDRDLIIRATAEGRDPKSTPVRESMTPEIVYCFEDQEASEAEQLMSERQIRRLAVLDHDKRLVGIVSLGDLATKTDKTRAVGKTLEKVSEPTEPSRPAIAL
jgi:CBS domain-containing protein